MASSAIVAILMVLVVVPSQSKLQLSRNRIRISLSRSVPSVLRRGSFRIENRHAGGARAEKEESEPPEVIIMQRADKEQKDNPVVLPDDLEGCQPYTDIGLGGISANGDPDLQGLEDVEERAELQEALQELQTFIEKDNLSNPPEKKSGGYGWSGRSSFRGEQLAVDELDMSIEDEDSILRSEVPVIDDSARDCRDEVLSADKFWGDTAPEGFRSGFISIIGSPNMGKSTLMNKLIGERLSITSAKAQTTRHRIMGIISEEDFQMIYWDTPGILDPNYVLQERMLAYIHRSIADADMLLIVTDVEESGHDLEKQSGISPLKYHQSVLDRLSKVDIPILVAVNKIDLLPEGEKREEILESIDAAWHARLPTATIHHVSAKSGENTEDLMTSIKQHLPTHPPWFDKDTLTDRNERFFVSEMIREKIFEIYHQEIPYSCEVTIKKFKSFKERTVIDAIIHVDRESQKGIVIGQKGAMIKKLSMAARQRIEDYVGKKVHLTLEVKLTKDWRSDEKQLRGLGYYNA